MPPPQAPPPAQQREIEARCSGFAPASPQLPWWATLVCQNRETFSGVAFGVLAGDADDPFPPQIFVATLLTQRPTSVYGMIASLRPRVWPVIEDLPPGSDLEFAGRPLYEVSEGAHVSVSSAGFSDEDCIVVFEGIRHVSGGVIVVSPPVPLEHFVCMWARAGGRKVGQRNAPRARPTCVFGTRQRMGRGTASPGGASLTQVRRPTSGGGYLSVELSCSAACACDLLGAPKMGIASEEV